MTLANISPSKHVLSYNNQGKIVDMSYGVLCCPMLFVRSFGNIVLHYIISMLGLKASLHAHPFGDTPGASPPLHSSTPPILQCHNFFLHLHKCKIL